MTFTRNDALSALNDVDSASRRSRTLFQYELASPYLVLWGVLWIVAGAIGANSPESAGLGWLVVDIIGFAGTAILAARQIRRYGEDGRRGRMLRYLATFAVLAAFAATTLMVFAPVTSLQVLMLITLLVATAYMTAGCWIGVRYAVVGAVLAVLAVGLFRLAPDRAALIVPFLGGGALVLGGLWMRRT